MANIWKCSCGQDNDGNFCINCGSTKPEGAENTVGAPAPAAVAPAEPVAAEVPAAAAPVAEVPSAAAPAAETPAAIAPAEEKAAEPVAPVAPAAPVEAAPVVPVAAAAAVAAVTPDSEPVQVIKCQPAGSEPMEDYASVPADPEFAEAEPVPVQPAYQPAPSYEEPAAVAAVAPVAAVPAQVGPASYSNTSSNPYSEPDRASHNPYAPAPVNAQPYNGGYAAAPATNSGIGVLILGIISVVLAFDVTLGAIICGAIGCSMAKKLKGPNGDYPTGKAKVGAILSKVGLIIGIVTTIIAIIWCIIIVVGIIAGAGYALKN